jgi:hypothetical protein
LTWQTQALLHPLLLREGIRGSGRPAEGIIEIGPGASSLSLLSFCFHLELS